jgi:transcriptional antiterminator NusG
MWGWIAHRGKGNYLVSVSYRHTMAFYAVSTSQGNEATAASNIASTDNPHIHAVLAPETLNAYIIVEADGESPVESAVAESYAANKMLPGQTSLQEVMSYLTADSHVKDVTEGDIVELTGGPYRGQNARVLRVDDEKDEVTVELHEETIPLSVNVPGEQLQVAN